MITKMNKTLILIVFLISLLNIINCSSGGVENAIPVYLTPVLSNNIDFAIVDPPMCDGKIIVTPGIINPVINICFGKQPIANNCYKVNICIKKWNCNFEEIDCRFGALVDINKNTNITWRSLLLDYGRNSCCIKVILLSSYFETKDNVKTEYIHQFYTTKTFDIYRQETVICTAITTPIVICPGDAVPYTPTITPTSVSTPVSTDTPAPAQTITVNIDSQTIAKEHNFISNGLLEIPYSFTGTVPADVDYDFQVVSNQTVNDVMKTGAPTELTVDKINKRIKFKPQATGSSINGTSNRSIGLKYRITFLYKSTPTQTFDIEQDDINRARQEYKWFQENGISIYVPNRDAFGGINNKLYVGTSAANYPIEAFLNRQLTQLHTSISGSYPNVFYTSTWRNPYFNLYLGSEWTSQHLLGKAVDCNPAGAGQSAADYQLQWNTVITLADYCLLEMGGRILRSSGTGWYDLEPGDDYYQVGRTWGYIPTEDDVLNGDSTNIEIGYQRATHYHLDNRYQ